MAAGHLPEKATLHSKVQSHFATYFVFRELDEPSVGRISQRLR
jgi:hypothetical protein